MKLQKQLGESSNVDVLGLLFFTIKEKFMVCRTLMRQILK
ncbi:hypothetical protein pb186bvf_002922 [Paramecium bursaria]